VEPPEWAGEPPECDHGQKRQYKSVMKKDGSTGHLFECAAVQHPEPGACPTKWINEPKKGK
jgi:hypothetical protein